MFVNQGWYKLGKGGRNPTFSSPFGQGNGRMDLLDCSGGTAWWNGHDRAQFMDAKEAKHFGLDYDKENGCVWYDCANIIKDATGKNHRLYRKVFPTEAVQPGDLVVYAHTLANGKRKRHVGFVLDVAPDFQKWRKGRKGWGKKLQVVHCSTGRNDKGAIRISDASLWERDGNAYIVRLLPFRP